MQIESISEYNCSEGKGWVPPTETKLWIWAKPSLNYVMAGNSCLSFVTPERQSLKTEGNSIYKIWELIK